MQAMISSQVYLLSQISFSRCLKVSLLVLLCMIGQFYFYIRSEKQIDSANTQRYNTHLLAEALRKSSNDLTRMVRSYVVTADQAYLTYFQQIIDIRDGKLPNPANYESIYRDYITDGIDPKRPSPNETSSINEQMKRVGFSREELDKLTTAKSISDQLTITEFQAINLLQLSISNPENRSKAQMLVFDSAYDRKKAEIMALIDDVMQLSDQRTLSAVQQATNRAWWMRLFLISLGSILMILIWFCGILFRNTLGAAPERVYELIRRLGNGEFDQLPDANPPSHSVMSHLLHTQTKLGQLETERRQALNSLFLMSRVFSEAQEGIFLTDKDGIVMDVNLAFLYITGFSRKESVGHPSSILNTDQHDSEFFEHFWQEIKQEGRWRGEIWSRKKSGELFASIMSFRAINDNDGELLCYLGLLTDITQLKLHQQEIEEIAYHDPLTQLPNRPLLADRMLQALARVDRNKDILAVACLDLDGFKAVNDQFGHNVGDALLIEVAHRLLSCVRSGDTVARLGGDEFAILLCEISTREHCEFTLQRILRVLCAPYNLCSESINHISGSIGYTLFPYDNSDADTLLRHADQAMYAAKQAGKNRFNFFDVREDKRLNANWQALARIEKAIQQQEFCLYIQPKINLKTGKLIGAEALVRWLHPIRGLTSPAEFLPLIEDNDISISLGEWVIQEALNLMQGWHEQGMDLPLSINVSARQLRQENFAERLLNLLNQYPALSPTQLQIEIVESAALDDLQTVSNLIARCKTLGVSFALDDFGTGYSALTYLKRLSVTTLKIDQSFVRGLLADAGDQAIVRGVIGLAKAFNTQIIAEGVEEWAQAECLLAMGCEVAQGFIIARPMPADEVVTWSTHFKMPNLNGGAL